MQHACETYCLVQYYYVWNEKYYVGPGRRELIFIMYSYSCLKLMYKLDGQFRRRVLKRVEIYS